MNSDSTERDGGAKAPSVSEKTTYFKVGPRPIDLLYGEGSEGLKARKLLLRESSYLGSSLEEVFYALESLSITIGKSLPD